jgi:Na+-transporting methylmalonyl-CoA/oxaloacetate decarboxylase gamma subunit
MPNGFSAESAGLSRNDWIMNVEVYSYSLFTTVLGMLVVFLSLSALSVMMVVLKRIFSGEKKKQSRDPKGKSRNRCTTGARPAGAGLAACGGSRLPGWRARAGTGAAERRSLERRGQSLRPLDFRRKN